MRRCYCDRVEKCRLCYLWHNDVRYRDLWKEAAKPTRRQCIHEGDIVSWCPAGNEGLHVHRCMHDDGPDTCRRGVECKDCKFYETPANTGTRNLIYIVYPVKGNGTWQRNVSELLSPRLHLFNGKKVVAIFSDERTDAPEMVREKLPGFSYILLKNNPRLREVAAFEPLMNEVINEPGVTFFAHAKGVTRPVNPGVSVHPWTDMLYAANLDYWPTTAESLKAFPITGAFKKIGRMFRGSISTFHYSGTFYWFDNAKIREKNWRKIDKQWWGTEAWPGVQFKPHEAGCTFCEKRGQAINLYSMSCLKGLQAEFETWKQEHESCRTRLTLETF